jgi:hypothetical protein
MDVLMLNPEKLLETAFIPYFCSFYYSKGKLRATQACRLTTTMIAWLGVQPDSIFGQLTLGFTFSVGHA